MDQPNTIPRYLEIVTDEDFDLDNNNWPLFLTITIWSYRKLNIRYLHWEIHLTSWRGAGLLDKVETEAPVESLGGAGAALHAVCVHVDVEWLGVAVHWHIARSGVICRHRVEDLATDSEKRKSSENVFHPNDDDVTCPHKQLVCHFEQTGH